MPANAWPIVHRLHHKLGILGSFQFQRRELAVTRHPQRVDDAPVTRGRRGNLHVDLPGVEACIDSGGIGGDQRLKPLLRLRAVEPVLGICSQGVTVGFQLVHEFLKSGPSLSGQHFLAIAEAKPHFPLPSAGELQAAETQVTSCDRATTATQMASGDKRRMRSTSGKAAVSAWTNSRRGTSHDARFAASEMAIRRMRQYSGSYAYSSTSCGAASAVKRWAVIPEVPRGTNKRSPRTDWPRARSRAL
jgi:hypothetical protein